MVDPAVVELVDAMSVDDQVELIRHVRRSWGLHEAPLSEADKRVLDERIADMEASPDSGVPLNEFMVKLRSRR
ncbi:MAG: addiction module protein [Bifidobacteriaceae bacterium]|nr:addiction module protein [Bifidobacteriaceae bacterium]